MQRVTVSEAAATLGVSKSQVSRQSRAWNLVGADRRFDLDAYRERRAAAVNPLMVRDHEAPQPTAAPGPASDDLKSATELYRARQADLLGLKLEREAGRSLPTDEVVSALAEVGSIFRGAALGLPSRVSVDLARKTDPDQIDIILTAAINEMLTELQQALQNAIAEVSAEEAAP